MLTETLYDIEIDEAQDRFDEDLDLLALITMEDEQTGAVAGDLLAAGLL